MPLQKHQALHLGLSIKYSHKVALLKQYLLLSLGMQG